MCKMKDLRFRILRKFEILNKSSSESFANDWLSQQHYDLGTIRRALIDLIDSDYIRLSSIGECEPVKWLNEKWDTTTHNKDQLTDDDKNKKSSERLVKGVGSHEKVADIRIYTTVKGLMFIKEYRRFKNYHYDKIIYIVLGAILGYFLTFI